VVSEDDLQDGGHWLYEHELKGRLADVHQEQLVGLQWLDLVQGPRLSDSPLELEMDLERLVPA